MDVHLHQTCFNSVFMQSFNPEEVVKCLETAIEVGYRHFDTAGVYQTESLLGQALKNKIADGTVKREDVFITSKVKADSNNAIFYVHVNNEFLTFSASWWTSRAG